LTCWFLPTLLGEGVRNNIVATAMMPPLRPGAGFPKWLASPARYDSRLPKKGGSDRDRFRLTDAQFARIALHLATDMWGEPQDDDRGAISGNVHISKFDGGWIDASSDQGVRKTLCDGFRKLRCFVTCPE
jgi:hypothetical protein